MSLTRMVKEHQRKKVTLKEENEQLKKTAIESVSQLTCQMTESINTEVSKIFLNQKKLEGESKKLQQETARFAKQTTLWINLADSFNNSLKELGDLENWAKIIENDITVIATTLEEVHKSSETS